MFFEQAAVEHVPEAMISPPIMFKNVVEFVLDDAFECPEFLFGGHDSTLVQRLQHAIAVGKQEGASHIKENKLSRHTEILSDCGRTLAKVPVQLPGTLSFVTTP